MKHFLPALCLSFIFFFPVSGFCAEAWQKPLQPESNRGLQAILPDPKIPGNFIVASEDGIFKGPQKGPWEKLSVPSGMRGVQKLFSFSNVPGFIFLTAGDGVYSCDLKGKTCERVFRSGGRQAPKPLTFAVDAADSEHWFTGTEKGLQESDDAGKTWFRFTHFRNEPISVIASFENRLVLAAGHLLFLSTDGAHFKPVFSSYSSQNSEEKELENIFLEDGEIFSNPSFETLIQSNDGHLWTAGAKGVFESGDLGKTWKALPVQGLGTNEVSSLAYSEKTRKLFAGTSRGIFNFDTASQRWSESYAGLDQTYVRGLTLVTVPESEILGAVTSSGFFFQIIFPENISPEFSQASGQTSALFQKLTALEPKSHEVQREAVKFANVRNSKIKKWQAESRAAALLPSFSFGKDLSRGTSIDLDRRGTNEPDLYITGPEDVSRGWDLDVSWDLGDFIFSSNQTSIDSREKLMIELRNDILAEVTRIYYERRRLQMEACFNPAPSLQEHLDKILRIDELTALLDSFTGRYFSKKLEEMYVHNADLEMLWEYQEVEKA